MGRVDSDAEAQGALDEIRRRFIAGDLDQAITLANLTARKALADQDAVTLAAALDLLGDINGRMGLVVDARKIYLAAEDVYRKIGSDPGIANVALSLGACLSGRVTRLPRALERALEGYERAGRKVGQGQAHLGLGVMARTDNRVPDAVRHLEAAIRLFEETSSHHDLANARFQVALLAAGCGAGNAVALLKRLFVPTPLAQTTWERPTPTLALARAAISRGDLDAAERNLHEAFRLFERVRGLWGQSEVWELRGELLLRRDDHRGAIASLASAADLVVRRWRRLCGCAPPRCRRRGATYPVNIIFMNAELTRDPVI